MAKQSYDKCNEISCWTNEYRGQTYFHMQQKPYKDEKKRSRYVFIQIESFPMLRQKLDSILNKGDQSDGVIIVRSDYEVVLSLNKPNTWELKVVPVEDRTKQISRIDIMNLNSFVDALKTIE